MVYRYRGPLLARCLLYNHSACVPFASVTTRSCDMHQKPLCCLPYRLCLSFSNFRLTSSAAMTKIIYLLVLTASTLAAAQSSPYFFAPDDCKSKASVPPPFIPSRPYSSLANKSISICSSYSSCVEPANAIDSCDIDDDPCACSAYNVDAR